MIDYSIKLGTNTEPPSLCFQPPAYHSLAEMNLIWLVGLVCLSAVASQSQNDLMISTPKRFEHRRKFCGRILADTLSLVCGGRYNEYGLGKRSGNTFGDAQSEDYVYDQPQYLQEEESSWPYLSRQVAAAFLPSPYHRRHRRSGVIEECCQNPCSLKELQSYCAAP